MNTIFLIIFLIWLGIFGFCFSLATTFFSFLDYVVIFILTAFFSSEYVAIISYNKVSTFFLCLVVGFISCAILYFILSFCSKNKFLIYFVLLYNLVVSIISSYYFIQFSFYVLNGIISFAEGYNANYSMLLIFKSNLANLIIHWIIILGFASFFFFIKYDTYCIDINNIFIPNFMNNFLNRISKNKSNNYEEKIYEEYDIDDENEDDSHFYSEEEYNKKVYENIKKEKMETPLLYKRLGIEKDATQEEIKTAYKKLAKKYHPDLNKDSNGAIEIMKQINEAYDILSNEEKRKEYDLYGNYK